MTRHQTRLFFAVPSRESEEEGETRRKLKKERLVNKLELFLADVYASRIEGSIPPPPPSPLSVRGRGRESYEGCAPKEVSSQYWDFFDESMRFVWKDNYKSDNHFRSFTIFQRVLAVVETKEKLEYWLYSVHNTWWWFKETGGLRKKWKPLD